MSRGTKLGLVGALVALVLLVGGGLTWRMLSSRPGNAAVLAFLNTEVGGGRAVFTDLVRQIDRLPDGTVRVAFAATGATPEPLYQPIEAAQYFTQELKVDVGRLQELRQLLNGPGGARVRELAGNPTQPPDPLQAIILRETCAKGAPVKYHGVLGARKAAQGWTYELAEGQFDGEPPRGSLRATLGKTTFLIGAAKDQEALRELAALQSAYAAQLATARVKYEDELRAARAARRDHFLAVVHGGALFTGTATPRNGRDEPVPLYLELTEVGTTNRQVAALLRNDGGWSESRPFQGEWRSDPEAEHFTVVLSTRSGQAVRDGGPFLQVNDTWTVSFDVDAAGRLTGQTNAYDYVFTPVPADGVAKLKAELAASEHALLAATAADMVYVGAAISKRTQASEPILLRFTQQKNAGALLNARLESPEREDWQRALNGNLQTNRYRADDLPVRLAARRADRSQRAADSSVFAAYELMLALRLDGDTLSGEDSGFVYRLTRASAAEIQRIQADAAERRRQFFAIVKAGAAYDGLIQNGNQAPSRLRFRIRQVETRDGTLRAVFESRDQPGVFREVTGSYDVAARSLTLGTGGKGRINRSSETLPPFFKSDGAFQIGLVLGDEGLTGGSSGWGEWSLTFPITAKVGATTPAPAGSVDTESGYPAFPQTRGAYVLIDEKWQPLPTNGGKPAYGATEVLNGINGLLKGLNGQVTKEDETRGDKLATLSFDGTQPPPAVARANVVIAYVGSVKRLTADLLQKYPSLRDEPPMEMAPTRVTASGTREVDLLRIAPGLAGFRHQRVAAALEEPKPEVTLHVCSSPLDPGTYAFIVNEEAYELRVQ
jgi:hypothetical protein